MNNIVPKIILYNLYLFITNIIIKKGIDNSKESRLIHAEQISKIYIKTNLIVVGFLRYAKKSEVIISINAITTIGPLIFVMARRTKGFPMKRR